MLIAAREHDPALPLDTIRAIWWAMWRKAPAEPESLPRVPAEHEMKVLAAAPAAPEHVLIEYGAAQEIAYQAAAAFRPSYFTGTRFSAHPWVVEAIRSAHIDGQRFARELPAIDRSRATAPELRRERSEAQPGAVSNEAAAWAQGARFALQAVMKIDSICWLTDSMREIGIKQAANAVMAERDSLFAAAPKPRPEQEPAGLMNAELAAQVLRRFQNDDLILGPSEQAALSFAITALTVATPSTSPDQMSATPAL